MLIRPTPPPPPLGYEKNSSCALSHGLRWTSSSAPSMAANVGVAVGEASSSSCASSHARDPSASGPSFSTFLTRPS